MAKLEVGAYFKVNGQGYEFKGLENPESPNAKIVGRSNPDLPETQGAIHQTFTSQEIEQSGVFIPPFGETLPYSIYAAEKRAWGNLLGPELFVPYPPAALVDTLKASREKQIDAFEPHFLPHITFSSSGIIVGEEELSYPVGWKKFVFLDLGPNLRPKELPGAWCLVDKTIRPDGENTPYPDDSLQPLIDYTFGWGTRFGIAPVKIKEEVLPYIKAVLSTTGEVRLPSIQEFNALGNMFYPEWGEADTNELMDNVYLSSPYISESDRAIRGIPKAIASGDVNAGGITNSMSVSMNSSSPTVGFRPIIIFSNQEGGSK